MSNMDHIYALAGLLFFMTGKQFDRLESRHEGVCLLLKEFPKDEQIQFNHEYLKILKDRSFRLTGINDCRSFFDEEIVSRLFKEYKALPRPELGSAEAMMELQLCIITRGICDNYIDGRNFYSLNQNLFLRYIPDLIEKNDLIGDINLLRSRDKIEVVLQKDFRSRYEDFERQGGDKYKTFRLANDAMCVLKCVVMKASGNIRDIRE